MMISTKGRYALRVMLDLAGHRESGYIPLAEIAARQKISEKYLESILSVLSKAGMLDALRGKGGGYRLCREPDEYSVGEILRAAEGSLAPVSCLECGAKPCRRAAECRTLPVWKEYYRLTEEFFDGISLENLMNPGAGIEYVI